MATRTFRPPHPTDLRQTLRVMRRGANDPTMRFAADGYWRASRTPLGPVTLRLRAQGADIVAEAWGDGAEWALEHAPTLVGGQDDPSAFRPSHPLVAELHHRFPGLRLPRSEAVVETLLPTIIEQRVTTFEARRGYHQLVRRYSDDAPGPGGLLLPPDPQVVASIPYYDLHQHGIERKRADALRRASAHASRLDETVHLPRAEAYERLLTIPGIGPWTAAEVGLIAFGDPDAVSVGDDHLPDQVAFAFTGQHRGDDELMLELLEPFAGQRGRVIRLIVAANLGPPRHAPRAPLRPIATQ